LDSPWIHSASFLPHTGEPIEFMLEEHGQSIYGTFANGEFHSRWADYDARRVASWRKSGVAAAAPKKQPTAAPESTFGSALKRLIGAGSRKPILTPLIVPRGRRRTTEAQANTTARNVPASGRVDSNQMSS
jgi:hypothetical protein